MQRVTIGDLKPDLTVILDRPVESACNAPPSAAARGRRTGSEAEDSNFTRNWRDAYRQIAVTSRSDACYRATADAGTVAASVWSALPQSFLCGQCRHRGHVSMSARQSKRQSRWLIARNHRVVGTSAMPRWRCLNAYRSGGFRMRG